jgi:hypothetical protein
MCLNLGLRLEGVEEPVDRASHLQIVCARIDALSSPLQPSNDDLNLMEDSLVEEHGPSEPHVALPGPPIDPTLDRQRCLPALYRNSQTN